MLMVWNSSLYLNWGSLDLQNGHNFPQLTCMTDDPFSYPQSLALHFHDPHFVIYFLHLGMDLS